MVWLAKFFASSAKVMKRVMLPFDGSIEPNHKVTMVTVIKGGDFSASCDGTSEAMAQIDIIKNVKMNIVECPEKYDSGIYGGCRKQKEKMRRKKRME